MAAADYTPLYQSEGEQQKVDPLLLRAVGTVESGNNPNARSPAGAEGIMQLMPATARHFGVTNVRDPAQNIHAGTATLVENLMRYKGKLGPALAAYNAGPRAVDRNLIRPETSGYVTKVLDTFKQLGGTVPPGTTIPTATLPDHAAVKQGKPLDNSHAVLGFNASEYEDLQRIAFGDPLVREGDRMVRQSIAADERAAAAIQKNIPEYAKLRERLKEVSKLPDSPDLKESPEEKVPEIRNPMQALTQFMPMLALLGGALNKNYAVASMEAATAAMNAQKSGDYAKRDEAHQRWLDNTKRVVEGNALMLNKYDMAMNRRKANMDEVKAEWEAIAAENGDMVTLANLRKGEMDTVVKGIKIHQTALEPVARAYSAALAAQGRGHAYTTSNGIPLNFANGMYTVAAGENAGQPYEPTRDGEIQTISGRPRNTGMQILQSARAEYAKTHNGAEMPVEEQKKFLIDYSAQTKAVAKFTSGKWQDNIVAANTALQHLDVLQQAAADLRTGDVQSINGFVQMVATEFGRPEAVDFNSAKEIVADELIKAVIGSGGGVTDRQAAKEKLKSQMSPQQMVGTIAIQKGLLAGRLDSLHRTYYETTQAEDFARFLSPAAAAAMRASGKDPNAPPETGASVPSPAGPSASGQSAAEALNLPTGGIRSAPANKWYKVWDPNHSNPNGGKGEWVPAYWDGHKLTAE